MLDGLPKRGPVRRSELRTDLRKPSGSMWASACQRLCRRRKTPNTGTPPQWKLPIGRTVFLASPDCPPHLSTPIPTLHPYSWSGPGHVNAADRGLLVPCGFTDLRAVLHTSTEEPLNSSPTLSPRQFIRTRRGGVGLNTHFTSHAALHFVLLLGFLGVSQTLE